MNLVDFRQAEANAFWRAARTSRGFAKFDKVPTYMGISERDVAESLDDIRTIALCTDWPLLRARCEAMMSVGDQAGDA